MPEDSQPEFPLSGSQLSSLGCAALPIPSLQHPALALACSPGQWGTQNNPVQLQLPSPSHHPESECFPCWAVTAAGSAPEPTVPDKAKSFRSPRPNTAVISLLFLSLPLCLFPMLPEAATCPTADLCVLGCSEHEIPALSAVAGAWNVSLHHDLLCGFSQCDDSV